MSWWNPFSWGSDDDDGPDPDDPNDERNYIESDKHGPVGNLYEYYEPSEWDEAIPDDYEPD